MEILDDTGAAEALEALLQTRAMESGYEEESVKAKDASNLARIRYEKAVDQREQAEKRLCELLDIRRCRTC